MVVWSFWDLKIVSAHSRDFSRDFAIAWSNSLSFAVEKAGKTLIGSAASGEGLVNVYRGTGRVLMAPVAKGPGVPILR